MAAVCLFVYIQINLFHLHSWPLFACLCTYTWSVPPSYMGAFFCVHTCQSDPASALTHILGWVETKLNFPARRLAAVLGPIWTNLVPSTKSIFFILHNCFNGQLEAVRDNNSLFIPHHGFVYLLFYISRDWYELTPSNRDPYFWKHTFFLGSGTKKMKTFLKALLGALYNESCKCQKRFFLWSIFFFIWGGVKS